MAICIPGLNWSDVRTLSIEGTKIHLVTDKHVQIIDCPSSAEVRHLLKTWARRDHGPVLLPDGISARLHPRVEI